MKGKSRTMVLVVVEVAALVIAGVVLLAVFRNSRQAPAALPESGSAPMQIELPLPAFELTERSGEKVNLDQLRGKVWIADFIFTRCAGPCPELTSRMYQVQEELRKNPQWDDIRLVTFTVDPDHDSPSVMGDRARIALADATHWLWLTGTREQIWQLIRDGFKLPVDENKENAAMPILHSQKFVLVDKAGSIRGFYDGLDDASRAAMLRDMEGLLQQQN